LASSKNDLKIKANLKTK